MSKETQPAWEPESGHYFTFDRGQWVKPPGGPVKRYPGSGLTYVGSLTLAQRKELDALIDRYIKSLEPTPRQMAHE